MAKKTSSWTTESVIAYPPGRQPQQIAGPDAPFPSRPKGWLRLIPAAGGYVDVPLTGPVVPLDASYESGFEITDRPSRVAATSWDGTKPLMQSAPFMFDGIAANRPVESAWEALIRLGRPPGGRKPPACRVEGPMLHRDHRWYVNSVQPSGEPEPYFDAAENLLRIAGTLVLLQQVDVDPVTVVDLEENEGRPAYRTRRGDTWQSVAKRAMRGDKRTVVQRIKALRQANRDVKVRSATEELPVGKRLVIPGGDS